MFAKKVIVILKKRLMFLCRSFNHLLHFQIKFIVDFFPVIQNNFYSVKNHTSIVAEACPLPELKYIIGLRVQEEVVRDV